jgi:glycosyltransferase involved in cell wall biosynthesis
MIRRAGAFVVNGRLSRAYLEQLGAPPQAIFEGGMCAFPLPERHKDAGPRVFLRGPVRFLFVGQLVDRKGVHSLLRAAALLQATKSCTDRFEIVIVGEGPKRAELLQMTSELHLEAIVKYVSFVSPAEVWDRYIECHVFVLPTLQDNWPLVVPEAMAMGLPIVISERAGSVPDLLREGHNGWTFNPERPASLAEILARYIEHPDLIESHGLHSVEMVRKYTPENAAEALLGAVNFARECPRAVFSAGS